MEGSVVERGRRLRCGMHGRGGWCSSARGSQRNAVVGAWIIFLKLRVEVEGACQVPDQTRQSQSQSQTAASKPDRTMQGVESNRSPVPLLPPAAPCAGLLGLLSLAKAGGASWQAATCGLAPSGRCGCLAVVAPFGPCLEAVGAGQVGPNSREKRNGWSCLGQRRQLQAPAKPSKSRPVGFPV